MGSSMALNLATYAERHHHPQIRVWNRTAAKAKELAPGYYQIAASLHEIGSNCNIVHGCLANDDVALAIYRELFKIQNKGSIYVDHSTLYPTTSKTLQAEAQKNGVYFLSCPVFGPPAAAKSAELLVVLSGDAEARESVKKYLVPSLGKDLIDCGDVTADGATLKLLGNSCILGTIELLSESFALAEKTNFDLNVFYNFIQKWFPTPAWLNYGKKIRDGAFSGKTGFTLPGGMKDASYIRRLGSVTSTPTPIVDLAWNHLTTAATIGGLGLDWSACAVGMRVSAGLKPFNGEDFSLDNSSAAKR
ncbi:NAD_binding_2 domain-containing protein [Trichoderma simmonsii]|uniref:NAD_binding_2 domain-containing protein n=1 Tax=Trichoderma simmonsii TaxID=1491479 RepID=A0A8G0LG53_9HYPO|nr:NAD_binding_2 domain-containing protein [Trichoderma simmonsii]